MDLPNYKPLPDIQNNFALNNIEFYLSIGIKDIPWNRIVGCYSRATNFPTLISKLTSNNHIERKNALNEISLNIEHQSTLYVVTPLTLIFLFRVLNFRKKIETDETICVEYVGSILNLILRILNIVKLNLDNIEISNPKIENLKGLLSEKYLWKEYENEEQEEINWEENICSEDYYYSINLNIVDILEYNLSLIQEIGISKWYRTQKYEIESIIKEIKIKTNT